MRRIKGVIAMFMALALQACATSGEIIDYWQTDQKHISNKHALTRFIIVPIMNAVQYIGLSPAWAPFIICILSMLGFVIYLSVWKKMKVLDACIDVLKSWKWTLLFIGLLGIVGQLMYSGIIKVGGGK